jgi:hypothetical protein
MENFMSKVRKSQSEASGSSETVNNLTKDIKMSPETQNAQNAAPAEAKVPTITKTYKYFDLTELVDKTEEVTIAFNPATSVQEAMGRIGNEQEKVLAALNAYLREQALDAAAQTVKEKGPSKKVFLDFCKSFRLIAPFKGIVATEKGDAGWKDQYKAQTKSIGEFIKGNETLLNGLRQLAATATSDEGGDEEDSE